MKSFKALLAFGLLFALIGSASVFEAVPEAHAQGCPGGNCPPPQ